MGLMSASSSVARPASTHKEPEDVFLAWLVGLPREVDARRAADVEIARLSGYRGPHPGPARLLEIFRVFHRSLPPRPGSTLQ